MRIEQKELSVDVLAEIHRGDPQVKWKYNFFEKEYGMEWVIFGKYFSRILEYGPR